jgi:hypothetical protein
LELGRNFVWHDPLVAPSTGLRAFHRESEEPAREVIRWVLSERDLPEHDTERMIERWAREQGAGVYAQNKRTGGLEHLEKVLVRTTFGWEPAA